MVFYFKNHFGFIYTVPEPLSLLTINGFEVPKQWNNYVSKEDDLYDEESNRV